MASPTTVLLVEDQVDNRDIIVAYLSYVGYRVLTAYDGQEAIEIAAREQPGLILMDISLPGLDGLDATRALKKSDATRHIPVVMFTAHVFHDDVATARDAGCDGYLMKPISPRDVADEVRRRIGPPAGTSSERRAS